MSVAMQLRELISLNRAAIKRGNTRDQLAIRLRIIAIYESQRCEYPRIVEAKS